MYGCSNNSMQQHQSVPRSSRQSDHTKTSWPSERDVNLSIMDMSSVHQVWPKQNCKALWEGEEYKADNKTGGKTTSENGQIWNSPSPRGQWKTGTNGGNWLRNHLWCLNYPRVYGIDDDDESWHACALLRHTYTLSPLPSLHSDDHFKFFFSSTFIVLMILPDTIF